MYKTKNKQNMKRKIASAGPSKNFLSQIETPYVSSCIAYAILELVPTWLRVPIWSGTKLLSPTSPDLKKHSLSLYKLPLCCAVHLELPRFHPGWAFSTSFSVQVAIA